MVLLFFFFKGNQKCVSITHLKSASLYFHQVTQALKMNTDELKQCLHLWLMWILTNRFWEYNKTCMLMIILFGIKWPNLLCFIEKGYFSPLPPHRNFLISHLIFFRQSAPSHTMMYRKKQKTLAKTGQRQKYESIGRLEEHKPTKKVVVCLSRRHRGFTVTAGTTCVCTKQLKILLFVYSSA